MMTAILEHWVKPSVPSPEEVKQERKYKKLREKRAAQQADRDRSWVEFIERLRKDPDQLRHIPAPTEKGVDARLYHLWLLLCEAVDAGTRYAIDSMTPLEPMLGAEVANAFRDALIRFWRQWMPTPKSKRSATERNRINSLDCMGIAGVSLEAAANSRWAEQLSSEEATRAATYGTLELNGFPAWFAGLAHAKPDEVRDVLAREVITEIADTEPRTQYEVLEDVSRSGDVIAELIAPVLLSELKRRTDIPVSALQPMLRIMVEGLRAERPELLKLLIDRFKAAAIPISALYMGAAFGVDATAATDALSKRLEGLDPPSQTELVQGILPDLFGTDFGRSVGAGAALDFATLERLVRIAFRTIRYEEDRHRPSGEVYSPDQRDNAEHARGAAFQRLAQTPGRATFAALHRLAADPECPIGIERLRELAYERAANDAESAPWSPGDAAEFEAAAKAAPRTAKDLQGNLLRRFAELQHDLLHGDFAQGTTLQGLPNERAVQNWVAERLRLQQGHAYSVEREPHVMDEKEPDVRVRARATDASVAVEIKVAESWTLPQLESALTDQLCGRYLRAHTGRHGILLLVHQHARSRGWEDPDTGVFLSLDELVERLRRIASDIASGSPDAPQPEITVLDVSR